MFGLSKREKQQKAFQVEFDSWMRRSNIEIARAIALDSLTGDAQRAALERIEKADEKQFQEEFDAYFRQWEKRRSRAALELARAVANDSLRGAAQRRALDQLHESERGHIRGKWVQELQEEIRRLGDV